MLKNNIFAILGHFISCIAVVIFSLLKLDEIVGSLLSNAANALFVILLFIGIGYFCLKNQHNKFDFKSNVLSVSSIMIVDIALWIFIFVIGKLVLVKLRSVLVIVYVLYNSPFISFLSLFSVIRTDVLNTSPYVLVLYPLIPTISMFIGLRMQTVRIKSSI